MKVSQSQVIPSESHVERSVMRYLNHGAHIGAVGSTVLRIGRVSPGIWHSFQVSGWYGLGV